MMNLKDGDVLISDGSLRCMPAGEYPVNLVGREFICQCRKGQHILVLSSEPEMRGLRKKGVSRHDPAPWREDLTPMLPAGFPLIRGEPTPVNVRILAEDNFQFAKKAVNNVENAKLALIKAEEKLEEALTMVRDCLKEIKIGEEK